MKKIKNKINQIYSSSWPFYLDTVNTYAYWEQAFSEEECNFITKIGKSKTLLKGPVLNSYNTDSVKIRNSKIAWLSPLDNINFVYERLTNIIMDLNNRYFKFDLYGMIENIQFTNYVAPQGKFHKHLDSCFDTPVRKLSVSIQLSKPEDYTGGELILHNNNDGNKMKKEQGTLVMFPSFTLHEVTPVTKGERNSLVVWITGPNFK
jgi:PKHD-type hydroxylase